MTEISRFFDDNSAELTDAVRAMVRAEARNAPQPLERFGEAIRKHMAAADLVGRMQVIRTLDRVKLAAVPDPVTGVARVTFGEALENIVNREPRLAGSAEIVRRVYSEEQGFALARSASLEVTKRVQAAVARGVRTGEIPDVLEDFTRAYSQVVLRTNIATAHGAGRLQQARALGPALPAFEYSAVRDSVARPDHRAMHGVIALTTAPVWDVWATPNGFSCRCSLRLVSARELRRRGIQEAQIANVGPPAGLAPDLGFSGRPDVGLY